MSHSLQGYDWIGDYVLQCSWLPLHEDDRFQCKQQARRLLALNEARFLLSSSIKCQPTSCQLAWSFLVSLVANLWGG